MSQFLESIKVENKKIHNLELHLKRIAATLESENNCIDLTEIREEINQLDTGLYKLRIAYDHRSFEYEILPYSVKSIKKLKIVDGGKTSYAQKFLDRTELENLYNRKADCDDILITKNDLFTDSYYCNVAFLQDGKWYTPKNPLLNGTKRQELLAAGLLIEKDIPSQELMDYSKCRLFNAMIEFGEIEVDTKQILN